MILGIFDPEQCEESHTERFAMTIGLGLFTKGPAPEEGVIRVYRAVSLQKAEAQSLVVLSATAGSRASDPLIAMATIPIMRIKPTIAFAFSQRSNVRWSAGDITL
jgi:hypothetical protein